MNPDILKAALDALESGDTQAIIDALKAVVAAMGSGGAPAEPGEATSGAPEMAAAPADPVAQATLSALLKITGAPGPAEAIERLAAMNRDLVKLRADSDAIELAQRQELVGELVKLGAEFPSTAWAGDPKDRKPVARLMSEPVTELRARVELFRANKPASRDETPRTNAGGLTDDEEKKAAKMTPDQKARFTALRAGRRAS